MVKARLFFQRTAAEKADPLLSWQRDDRSFFASGACHILAYAFMKRHPNDGFYIVYLKPLGNNPGTHLYVTNGEWAFDYEGWTPEHELLRETKRAYSEKYPGWDYERAIVEDDLEAFCKKHNHRLPSQFPFSPWERAENYIEQFGSLPTASR